eukprot:TRINITY_DN13087_c0_g1_i1.p1 TRINITY_DN13087_c0_g1~~TRINITY_DN13087_c0_g1_i1.p1  ORF type:complete len:276 (+),score=24.68 TRINITY_DN13087_c0_g1_i1:26-853(+)
MNKKERLLDNAQPLYPIFEDAAQKTAAETMRKGKSYAKRKAEKLFQKFDEVYGDLKETYRHGHWTLQMLCFIGGLAIFILSILSFINILQIILNPFTYLINVYICMMSFTVVVFEFPVKNFIISYIRQWFEKWLKAFDRLFGRGIFYILLGILVSTAYGWIGIIFGVYMAVCGVISLLVGFWLSRKLNQTKRALHSSFGNDLEKIQIQFDRFDTDRNGFIDATEFGSMCASLGIDLSPQERDYALNMLDKNRDGLIDIYEFTAWYNSRTRLIHFV